MPDIDPTTTLLSVTSIVALVSFLKQLGVAGKALTLAAVLLGVAAGVVEPLALDLDVNLYQSGVTGLFYGLGAAGLYDLAKTTRSGLIPVDDAPLPAPEIEEFSEDT